MPGGLAEGLLYVIPEWHLGSVLAAFIAVVKQSAAS